VAICYDPDEGAARARGPAALRFAVPGWPVQEVPEPRSFDARQAHPRGGIGRARALRTEYAVHVGRQEFHRGGLHPTGPDPRSAGSSRASYGRGAGHAAAVLRGAAATGARPSEGTIGPSGRAGQGEDLAGPPPPHGHGSGRESRPAAQAPAGRRREPPARHARGSIQAGSAASRARPDPLVQPFLHEGCVDQRGAPVAWIGRRASSQASSELATPPGRDGRVHAS